MAQPLITDLFGTGSTFDAAAKKVTIPLTALPALTNASPTPLEIYGAIIAYAHTWLNANTDLSVSAACDLNAQAPLSRNGTLKTQYQYSVRFFGPYTSPNFDPNQI